MLVELTSIKLVLLLSSDNSLFCAKAALCTSSVHVTMAVHTIDPRMNSSLDDSGETPRLVVSAIACSKYARPGGNVTGVNYFTGEVAAKRLGLLRELVPRAARVAVLVNPGNARAAESTVRAVQAAAGTTGLQIRILNASTIREIDAAYETLVQRTCQEGCPIDEDDPLRSSWPMQIVKVSRSFRT